MAAIVVTQLISRWTGNEKSRAAYLRALEPGDLTALKDLETMVLDLPHFEIYGTTDTNTADSDAINLNDQGVTFPAGFKRLIEVHAFVADGSTTAYRKAQALITGGTTPVIEGELVVGNDTVDTNPDFITATPVVTFDFEVVSDEVIIEAVGESSDVVTWVIHVFVSDLIRLVGV